MTRRRWKFIKVFPSLRRKIERQKLVIIVYADFLVTVNLLKISVLGNNLFYSPIKARTKLIKYIFKIE